MRLRVVPVEFIQCSCGQCHQSGTCPECHEPFDPARQRRIAQRQLIAVGQDVEYFRREVRVVCRRRGHAPNLVPGSIRLGAGRGGKPKLVFHCALCRTELPRALSYVWVRRWTSGGPLTGNEAAAI